MSAIERVGVVYRVQPEPIDASSTEWFEAGPVRFGLESRHVTPEALREAYRDDPAALAEIEENSPEGGFSDDGVSIHVLGTSDGHEYLRFDVFAGDPHYHYIHRSGDRNHWIPFDFVSSGDMEAFVLRCLRERLAPMLTEAGGADLAEGLDSRALGSAIDALALRLESVREDEPLGQGGA